MMLKILLIFCLMIFTPMNVFSEANIKKSNVAGKFYTADPRQLTDEIKVHLTNADTKPIDGFVDIIIVPHAGIRYSGPVAAHAFNAVKNNQYNTIVILAPTHYFQFEGVSIWPEGKFETPLGQVEVDVAFAKTLMAETEGMFVKQEYFEKEHSLEVELPFIQHLFPKAKIVPMINGRQLNPKTLMSLVDALDKTIGNRKDVLIVISTDMSHFHDDAKARKLDQAGIDAIQTFDIKEILENNNKTMEIDGVFPVLTAIKYAQKRGLSQVDVLKYGNSGDVSNDRSKVVGYVAMAFYKGKEKEDKGAQLTHEQKKKLVRIARQTVDEYIATGKTLEFDVKDPRLLEEEGAFVTLHKHKILRGCMGNIIGRGPLAKTVRDMAIVAATQDPRFRPVTKDELTEVDVEVSVLSIPRVEKDPEKIVMGTHGVIISRGGRGGVFLPQVATETGWSREEFLGQLCSQKAGLPADCWKDSKTKLEVFTAQVFDEHEFADE